MTYFIILRKKSITSVSDAGVFCISTFTCTRHIFTCSDHTFTSHTYFSTSKERAAKRFDLEHHLELLTTSYKYL